MGQYYTPILMNGNVKKAFHSHDYSNGLKLMEHSYIGNHFVETIVKFMLEEKKPYRLAWVGDYAEPTDVKSEEVGKFITYERNENKKYFKPDCVGDMENSSQLYFVNHTKKEYVDMRHYILENEYDDWGCMVHPLPLLTAVGNGKGGGDYSGSNMEYIGRWACDEIEVVAWLKEDKKYEEYKELWCPFKEGR